MTRFMLRSKASSVNLFACFDSL